LPKLSFIKKYFRPQLRWNTWKGRIFKYSPSFLKPLFNLIHFVNRRKNSSFKYSPKILILAQNQGIGDAILYSCAIKVLRNEYPNSIIKLICTENSYQITKYFKSIDFIEPFKFNLLEDLTSTRKWKPDIIIDFYAGFSLYSALLALLSNCKVLIGFDFWLRGLFYNVRIGRNYFTTDLNAHFAEMCLGLINKAFGISHSVMEIGFENEFATVKILNWAKSITFNFDKPIVALQPGARDDIDVIDKRWPARNYIKLAKKIINDLNGTVVILGSPSEAKYCESIEKNIGNESIVNYCGKTSVLETTAVLKCCDVLICNNSGLLHIAAALGVPTISFSGGINLSRWKPYFNDIHKIMFNNYNCNTTLCLNCSLKGEKCFNPISSEKVFSEFVNNFNLKNSGGLNEFKM
jgi:ADP-heptose:LPS heptosyltransferase